MELTNEFTVGVPISQAWALLTDVERIAPCLPDAQLQEVEGDEYRGIVKVKVGPITAQYKGAARFLEQDAPRRAVLRAEGRETRGQGNASATITALLEDAGDTTRVVVSTDLTVSGKVAQFGRGVLADVSAKLLTQFVACLESTLVADKAAAPLEPGGVDPTAPAVAMEPIDGEPVDEPSAPVKPAVRSIDSPDVTPVDLVSTAGAPVAKRVGAATAVVAVLWLLRLLLKRRKR